MAATTVTIPDFDFSAFYYAQILEALAQYRRVNVPEITDESAFEPFIQLERMMSLVGHLNNVLIDLVANESTLPTSKLTETVRNMLRLIDYELSPATPAQVDLIYELAKVFAASATVISTGAQASTKKVGIDPVIYFEALEELTIDRTDQFSNVFADEGGTFTDYTAEANSPTTPADDWSPWATPAVADAIYFGHAQAMWDALKVGPLTTLASGITGVWEYYDGDFRKAAPTSVSVVGSTLEIDLTSYLGTQARPGTTIRVMLNETTAYEDVTSQWDGLKNYVVTGLLGQTSPTTDPTKYTVGSDWEILDVADATADFTVGDDVVEYTLPQTEDRDWTIGAVNGIDAYWLRYRIVAANSPTAPTFQGVRLDEGKQYVKRLATQGRSVEDSPLGSSTGLPSQEFETTRDYFINESETVYVDGVAWERVDNFLASAASSEHYTIELGTNDRATVKFGDGTAGRIPPLGVNNIRIEYRITGGPEADGNVGANTVLLDKTGLSYVSKLWNPRQANGWAEADGATETSLEQAKIAGPASLRSGEVALGPSDVEQHVRTYTDDDGAKPFSRVRVFEEGFGPKTMEATVVARGGGLASAEQLAALEEYFNGDQYAYPPLPKRVVANQEVIAVNYTPKVIDVTATVYGEVTAAEVENRLAAVVHPEALKSDGVTWEWDFGGEVDDSRINHEIFETDESITKVTLTAPAGPVSLAARELPILGTVSITVVEP